MRLLGYTVAKDEAHRYLDSCLAWQTTILDEIALYDDQSSDKTSTIASWHGVKAKKRPDDVPTFLQHEGKFRSAAWEWFEEAVAPRDGDWVLAFDADDFLVSKGGVRAVLFDEIKNAKSALAKAIHVPIPEVFGAEKENNTLLWPRVRKDGYWGTIVGHRIFQYQKGATFLDKPMGCGAEPDYVQYGPFYSSSRLFLLHYGYADEEDRKTKYDRYTGLVRHGHANSHIQSILESPVLEKWEGPWPIVWRGYQ